MIKIKGIKQLEKSEMIEAKGSYCADYFLCWNFTCNYFSLLQLKEDELWAIEVEGENLHSA